MLTESEREAARAAARRYFTLAQVALTESESAGIEVADFGLGELHATGLQLVAYVNTERVCAKELVLFPGQTCPEHRHPAVGADAGKEETFRCRWGTVFLYVSGAPAATARCAPPSGREHTYTVWHEVELRPGDQYTIAPDTLHWFQAGAEGTVVSEFSTRSRDELDVFTDASIVRVPAARRDGGSGI